MASPHPNGERDKVASKLPAALRQELKIRAAELGTDIQDAVTEAVVTWRSLSTSAAVVDTAGADSFSTWLPTGLYEQFKDDCSSRGVSNIQGLAQAVRLWLDMHPSPRHSRGSHPQRKIVANQKGGVGKTAVSAGLAQALAEGPVDASGTAVEHGPALRVLLVDFDPQGHLSDQLGVPQIAPDGESLVKHMTGEAKGDLSDVVVPIPGERFGGRLHLLPSCADGFLLSVKLSHVRAREAALERALGTVEGDYDVVVVDCPPSLGLDMDSAIYYARTRKDETAGVSGVLIPVEAEDSSATAYGMLTGQIDDLADDLSTQVHYLGLVVNKYDSRRGYIARSSLEKWESLGDPPVAAIIPDLKEQREAVRMHRPLLDYAPDCEQANIFRSLAREVS
ncbi:ParA family protein [Wenjunlia tyrosinilytica]|uniref:Phosphopantetheine--protein transferase n=1 Tax=Wenjunlia tyrosinilytica TaxID=1544741 RepID=A0A918E0R1_9ACTN|nr:ParA family protein [Wenjunlia tyrosinilytica]GGO97983.1 phosphopantetheine--protein transferase [Wenjunlia tyrosinilytica]